MNNPIGVYNEWGKLREVIVGVLPDDAIVPTPTHMGYAYLDKATLALLEKHQGQPLKDLAPELVEGTARQLDGLAGAYEKAGVKVHRARPLTGDELRFGAELAVGGAPVYVRDPILVVGNHLIELAIKTPYRRREIFGIRELLERRVAEDPRARYYSMPPPRPVKPTPTNDVPDHFSKAATSSFWARTSSWEIPDWPPTGPASTGSNVRSIPKASRCMRLPSPANGCTSTAFSPSFARVWPSAI